MRRTTLVHLVLLGSLVATGILYAQDQEPPPYQGGAPQPGDAAAPPPEAAPAPGDDPAVASVDYFHDQLSPYGQWVVREGYGEVWVPRVTVGWRPYTTGHWIYTDQGWAWVADEGWGWAAFHYGRWYYDRGIGWAWLPGSVWAPAWVSWRNGGGYLGWAPLGPSIGFNLRVGLGAELTVGIGAGYYTFVHQRDFLSPRISGFIEPSRNNVTIVNNTVNVTNYRVVNNHIVNGGVAVTQIQQATGRPVQTVPVASLTTGGAGGRGAFYQPAVVTRAAAVNHAEFGGALKTQIAVQQKSRSFAAVSHNALPTTKTTGVTAGPAHGTSHSNATSVGGQGSKSTAATGSSTTKGTFRSTGSATGNGHKSTGSSGPTGPGSGSPKVTGSTGTSHATGSTGSSHNPSTGGGTSNHQSTQHSTPPPPKPKTPPPPKEKPPLV